MPDEKSTFIHSAFCGMSSSALDSFLSKSKKRNGFNGPTGFLGERPSGRPSHP
jgi:hypothetical protein